MMQSFWTPIVKFLRAPDLAAEAQHTFRFHLAYALLDAAARGILLNAPLVSELFDAVRKPPTWLKWPDSKTCSRTPRAAALTRRSSAAPARAGDDGADIAYFTDLPNSGATVDDVFYFKSHRTESVSASTNVTARAFDEVHATASESGFDVARIYDTIKDSISSVRATRRGSTETWAPSSICSTR